MRPAFVEERYMKDPAAMSAADPTESYAPGKSHEISRCTPYPASVPREDDTKCYARGARVPHVSIKKPHSPGPIAHTGTRRRRIIRYYAATTRCTTAWKLWPSVASLEHRTGAEHLKGVEKPPSLSIFKGWTADPESRTWESLHRRER